MQGRYAHHKKKALLSRESPKTSSTATKECLWMLTVVLSRTGQRSLIQNFIPPPQKTFNSNVSSWLHPYNSWDIIKHGHVKNTPSIHGSRQKLHRNPRALLHTETWSRQSLGIGRPLERHQFSGLVHSEGELLHTS